VTVLAEKCLDMNHDPYICFIDFEKAFDKVQHQKLIEILQQLGLDGRNIHIIKNLYWRQKERVRVDNQTTDEVQINRGIRQSCIISPILFNVYSERIIENALTDRPEGIKINGVLINNIRYADDTALIAGTEQDLQILLDRVMAECNNMRLKINTTETKVMVISKNNVQTNIISDNVRINQVHTHRYLGCIINDKMDCKVEVKARIEVARSAFIKYKTLLCSRQINQHLRLRLLQCYV
jgi:hypothetical protein